jgi:hypothetical protein
MVAGFARPRRAVKPNAASRRAEGAGLTAKARTERSSMSPQCGSSSDTVREIKYQILQVNTTAHLALQHDQLMSKRGILCLKPALRLEERGNYVQQEGYQREHSR